MSAGPPARRRRTPTAAEKRLWRLAVEDAAPLPGRSLPPEPAPPPPPTPEPKAKPEAAVAPPPAKPPAARPAPSPAILTRRAGGTPGIDTRTGERLRRGQLPIEGRLDLHGMTQDAAHAALARFIAHGYDRGLRTLLVITGKGARPRVDPDDPYHGFGMVERPTAGILRSAVPRWLDELPNRARVLAYAAAQPEHGGGGALYVLLRRKRE